MRRPFVAADGHSYEEGLICAWLRDHATSPMTNAPLPSMMVVPNHSLRAAIEVWEGQRPLELDPGCLTILPEEPLGNGSFGCVVAGLFTMHGHPRPVAVKTLPAMTRAEQRSQFARELKAHDVAQRSADRVCRLFGICDKDGRTCLVMKRYARNLADWLAAGPLAGAAVRRVGTALCRTLAQLHDAGIVVQDIKPANVLLDEHDEPVFSDFGIASVVERTTLGVRPTSVKGTFNYMAPEAFEASQYGKEVDIWSMGCLIVEMATGVAPWARLQMQQIITAVLIRKQTPEVPDGLPEAVGRCFAFDPHGRPTAAALAAALAADALADEALAAEAPVRNAHTANTAEIEALRQAHAAEVQSLRDDLAAAMNVSALANARAVSAEAAVEDVTALVGATRDLHGVKMRALRDAHAAEMEALRDAHAAEMDASLRNDPCVAQKREHAKQHRDAHAAEMESLRDELETVHELCTAHEDEIERLKRSLSISERAHEAAQSKPNVQQHFGSISLATCHWAAKRGDATAQFTMANFYYTGMEVSDMQLPWDMSKALKWWRRATNQGHAEASAALESQAAQGVFEELTEMPKSIAALIKVFRAHSYVGGSSSPKYLVMKTKAGTSHTLVDPTIKPDYTTGGSYQSKDYCQPYGGPHRDGNTPTPTCCGNTRVDGRFHHSGDQIWLRAVGWNVKPDTPGRQEYLLPLVYTAARPEGVSHSQPAIIYYMCQGCCGSLGIPR